MVNVANEARIPIQCKLFGLFRDLIPAQLLEEGASWVSAVSALTWWVWVGGQGSRQALKGERLDMLHQQGPGHVSLGQGRSDHSGCKGSCREEGGGHEAGGGDEEGEEGPMDGVPVGARLGKTGQLPYSGVIVLKP